MAVSVRGSSIYAAHADHEHAYTGSTGGVFTSLQSTGITGSTVIYTAFIRGTVITGSTITGSDSIYTSFLQAGVVTGSTITGSTSIYSPIVRGTVITGSTVTGSISIYSPSITGDVIYGGVITGSTLTGSTLTVSSLITPSANNTVDLGTVNNEFKDGYFTGSLYVTGSIFTTGQLSITNFGGILFGDFNIYRGAAGTLYTSGGLTVGSDIISDTADTDSLGSTTKEWLNAYIGDAGKLYFGLAQDVALGWRAANKLNLAVGDHLELDQIYLDSANRDVYLYRYGAGQLGISGDLIMPLTAIRQSTAAQQLSIYGGLDDTGCRFILGAWGWAGGSGYLYINTPTAAAAGLTRLVITGGVDIAAFNVVNSNFQIGGTTVIDSARLLQNLVGCNPDSAGDHDLGTDALYWNDINYKTLDDRGCLFWAEEGVKLNDGRIVSDLEALKLIQKAPWMSNYGYPALDFRTVPSIIHSIPKHPETGEELPFDEENPEFRYHIEKNVPIYDEEHIPIYNEDNKIVEYELKQILIGYEDKKILHHDGIKLDGLVSIMLGAIKELNSRLTVLEAS